MDLSRYYPQEAAAVYDAATQAAEANNWPPYLLSAIPALFSLTDDRTDPGDGGGPTRGAWLAALAALWVADMDDDEIPPGYQKISSFIGDAANLALGSDYRSKTAPSAFRKIWDEAVRLAGSVARATLEITTKTSQELGKAADKGSKRILMGLGLVATILGLSKLGGR